MNNVSQNNVSETDVSSSLAAALGDVRARLLDDGHLVKAVAAGRRRNEHPTYRRVELRWVDLRDGRRLQLVRYDERQAFTRNVEPAGAAQAVDEVLAEPYANWHVTSTDGTLQLRVTKRGQAQVHHGPAAVDAPERTHDRRKPRLVDPSEPFLRAVGISDAQGRVKPSRQAKFRQVEEFLRALQPVVDDAVTAAGSEPLRVVDLGCGNAYLTFAAYRWLQDSAADTQVRLTGVDVKAQARDHNADVAGQLGWADSVSFVEGTIADVQLEAAPHLVLALHACDTATDDALARAVEWGAPVVLAAPCCHHDLQRQLRAGSAAPAPYGLATRHGILRERLADVLTDTVRATILRLLGYRVDVIEFVDSKHTPRNALLRAVYTGAPPTPELVEEYRRLVADWRIEPALATRLGARLPA